MGSENEREATEALAHAIVDANAAEQRRKDRESCAKNVQPAPCLPTNGHFTPVNEDAAIKFSAAGSSAFKPVPAPEATCKESLQVQTEPLPEEVAVARALARLGESTIGVKSEESEIVSDIRIALRHITTQARRLAEVEALDNTPAEYLPCANCGAQVQLAACRHWNDEGEPCCCQECLDEHDALGCPLGEGDGSYRENPRIRKAEARVRELEAAAATRPLASDDEQTIADLESFKARVMAWARDRCETCAYMAMDVADRYGAACGECDNGTNWTPPQAWETDKAATEVPHA